MGEEKFLPVALTGFVRLSPTGRRMTPEDVSALGPAKKYGGIF